MQSACLLLSDEMLRRRRNVDDVVDISLLTFLRLSAYEPKELLAAYLHLSRADPIYSQPQRN